MFPKLYEFLGDGWLEKEKELSIKLYRQKENPQWFLYAFGDENNQKIVSQIGTGPYVYYFNPSQKCGQDTIISCGQQYWEKENDYIETVLK